MAKGFQDVGRGDGIGDPVWTRLRLEFLLGDERKLKGRSDAEDEPEVICRDSWVGR